MQTLMVKLNSCSTFFNMLVFFFVTVHFSGIFIKKRSEECELKGEAADESEPSFPPRP